MTVEAASKDTTATLWSVESEREVLGSPER